MVVVIFAGLLFWLDSGRDRALAIGYGDFGFGFGFGIGGTVPSPTGFLNDHSIASIGAAAANRPQSLRAPIPVSRDAEFFTRYDAETRLAMEDRVARTPRRPLGTINQQRTPSLADRPTAPVADFQPQARKIASLSSFFNAMRQLVWPADAPTEGDLAAKRAASDAKTLEMYEELRNKGYAYLSTATEARASLLEYGRPALRFMRETATPAISDAFHSFLRALYDSIGESPDQVLR
jgi:hypothetical protein